MPSRIDTSMPKPILWPPRKYAADSGASGAVRGSTDGWLCNCVGPQPGEKHCPCRLRVEREKERDMLANGVVIGGQRYRLTPAP